MAPSSPSWFPATDSAAVYVYAIVTSPLPDLPADGVEEQSVHGLSHDPFGVAVSVVDPSEWTGDTGAEHMKDLTWVGPRAYQHEQVVEAITEASPAVFPARFGTLFSTPERVRETLAARADTLREFLTTVEGMEEWAVKGLVDRDRAADRQVEAVEDEASGTAYLKQQKRRQEASRELDAWLDEVADTLFAPLAERAEASQVLSVPADGGREQEVAFNWAFLVPEAERAAFQGAVDAQSERYADAGVTLDLTGPWPPYNFRPSLDNDNAESG